MRKAESSKKLNKVSTNQPHLIEQKEQKMKEFRIHSKSAWGTGAHPGSGSLDSTTYKSGLLNLVEPLATISTSRAYAPICNRVSR
jgi:hypothetical protein